MQHTNQLELIRDVVTNTFAEYDSSESDFSESVLIREGFYCGRCFNGEQIRAIWFAEENVVKFYAGDGQFLTSHRIAEAGDTATRRRAA